MRELGFAIVGAVGLIAFGLLTLNTPDVADFGAASIEAANADYGQALITRSASGSD
ncbi:MAG: hypothetical protein SGJ21_17350 [Alphaproteobacteria bacterium]|nr:hypothetical protein [Alphaproteobacteria bacterium]